MSRSAGKTSDAAIAWILRNQLGRRNLHPDAASLLRGRLYNRQKAAVPNPKGVNQYTEVGYQSDTQPTTAERLASQLGVSAPTIKRDGKFAEAVETLRLSVGMWPLSMRIPNSPLTPHLSYARTGPTTKQRPARPSSHKGPPP